MGPTEFVQSVGFFWISHLGENPKLRALFATMGGTISEALHSLNSLHNTVSESGLYPNLSCPQLEILSEAQGWMKCLYTPGAETRCGLMQHLMVGIIKGLGYDYFGLSYVDVLISEERPGPVTSYVLEVTYEANLSDGAVTPNSSFSETPLYLDSYHVNILFPFHFFVDKNSGEIVEAGPSFRKCFDLLGRQAQSVITVTYPNTAAGAFQVDILAHLSFSLDLCCLIVDGVEVRGQVLVQNGMLVFMVNPAFKSIDDMVTRGLKISDFAFHDTGISSIYSSLSMETAARKHGKVGKVSTKKGSKMKQIKAIGQTKKDNLSRSSSFSNPVASCSAPMTGRASSARSSPKLSPPSTPSPRASSPLVKEGAKGLMQSDNSEFGVGDAMGLPVGRRCSSTSSISTPSPRLSCPFSKIREREGKDKDMTEGGEGELTLQINNASEIDNQTKFCNILHKDATAGFPFIKKLLSFTKNSDDYEVMAAQAIFDFYSETGDSVSLIKIMLKNDLLVELGPTYLRGNPTGVRSMSIFLTRYGGNFISSFCEDLSTLEVVKTLGNEKKEKKEKKEKNDKEKELSEVVAFLKKRVETHLNPQVCQLLCWVFETVKKAHNEETAALAVTNLFFLRFVIARMVVVSPETKQIAKLIQKQCTPHHPIVFELIEIMSEKYHKELLLADDLVKETRKKVSSQHITGASTLQKICIQYMREFLETDEGKDVFVPIITAAISF